MEERHPRWSSRTKIVVTLLVLALAIYLLYRFSVVLAPMALAVILAYIISPLVSRLVGDLKLSRGLATLLAYLFVLIILFTIPALVLPPLLAQVDELNLDFQRFLVALEDALARHYVIMGIPFDGQEVYEEVMLSLRALAEPFLGQTLGFVVEAITSLVWVIFIAVVSFYLVKDGPALREWTEKVVPPGYLSDYQRMRDEINRIWSAFFRGQIVLATVVASIFTIGGILLGLPFALTMGVLAGLLEFLPSVGHGIWLTIASILAFFLGSTWIPIPNWAFMLILIGIHLVFQQFDLNYLIPRIIGRSVHLPPLIVILGIVTGAVLAGVLGILLAAPTIASARVIARYVYANLFDMEPFPSSFVTPLPPPNPRWWRRSTPAARSNLET